MSASVKAGKAPDKYWRAQLAPTTRAAPGREAVVGEPGASLSKVLFLLTYKG